MQAPYQRFTFPPSRPATSRSCCARIGGGGYIAAYEFRLLGKLDESAAAAPPAPQRAASICCRQPTAAPCWRRPRRMVQAQRRQAGPCYDLCGRGRLGLPRRQAGDVRSLRDADPAHRPVTTCTSSSCSPAMTARPARSARSASSTPEHPDHAGALPGLAFAPVTRVFQGRPAERLGRRYIAAYDIRLFGAISEAAAATTTTAAPASTPTPTPTGIDLLSPANGGALSRRPTTNGPSSMTASPTAPPPMRARESGVQGRQARDLRSLRDADPRRRPVQRAQFELLAGDDSPTGAFRSIGVFTTQNTKMMQSPYQVFKLPAGDSEVSQGRAADRLGRRLYRGL